MKTTNLNKLRPTATPLKRDPVKLTALIYLREALLHERFEECPLFIQIAYEFGALDYEIETLLEDPRRNPKG